MYLTDQVKSMKKIQELFEKFIERQRNMSSQDPVCVSAMWNDCSTDRGELLIVMLQKILACDHSYRSYGYFLCSTAESRMEKCLSTFCVHTFDVCISGDSHYKIHPMDVFLAIITCADNFLRQRIFSRLAACHLAVPFILPDCQTKDLIFPLWAMRSIVKEWKCSGCDVTCKQSIVRKPMPFIAFIRFSKQLKSKSKLINHVMSNSMYDHFYHRDMGSCVGQVLSGGLIDICWYLPAGKPADIFPDVVAFVNLHGDARNYPKQHEFLRHLSLTCFVFVTENDLEDHKTTDILTELKSSTDVVLLINSSNPLKIKDRMSSAHILLSTRNIACVKTKVRDIICEQIEKKSDSFKTIEELRVLSNEVGLICDENDNNCAKAKEFLSCSSHLIAPKSASKLKCQSLWLKKETKQHRQVSIREKASVLPYDAREPRKLESFSPGLEEATDFHTLMYDVAKVLACNDELTRNYVLQYLYLDNCSSKHIMYLKYKYQQTICELHSKMYTITAEKVLKDLQKLHTEICNGLFKSEYFLQELGHLYELVYSKYDSEYLLLPQTAAKYVLGGYPFQIIDAISADLQMPWILAVFHELNKILCDRKVFVMSVVGSQSSILLSTMFNHCHSCGFEAYTNGAVIRIIPVSDTLKSETGYDYMLIIDFPGLSALNISNDYQICELLFFIMCLANVTLVNLNVEALNSEVFKSVRRCFNNVHKLKLDRPCQYILHKCSLLDEERHLFDSSIHDEAITTTESCTKNAYNLPDAWVGDHPMATINPAYVEKAQALRLQIVELMKQTKNVSIDSFILEFKTLWGAILLNGLDLRLEDIFDVGDYSQVEVQLNDWKWIVQELIIEWKRRAEKKIENCESSQLKTARDLLKYDLTKEIMNKRKILDEEIDTFFNEENGSIILLPHFKSVAQKRLERFLTATRNSTIVWLERFPTTDERCDLAMVLKKGRNYSANVEERHLGENELRVCFDEWIGSLDSKTCCEQFKEVALECLRFFASPNCVLPRLNADFTLVPHRHIIILPFSLLGFNLWNSKSYEAKFNVVEILDIYRDYLKGMRSVFFYEDQPYSLHSKASYYFMELIKDVKATIEDKSRNASIEFTEQFEIDVCANVCGLAIKQFKDDMITLQTGLREFKSAVWLAYRNQYFHTECEKTAAIIFCNLLMKPIYRYVLDLLCQKIVCEMRQLSYFRTKKALKYKVLIELGDNLQHSQDISEIVQYRRNTLQYLKERVKVYVDNYCDSKVVSKDSNLKMLVNKLVLEVCESVKETATEVSTKVKNFPQERNSILFQWVSSFAQTTELPFYKFNYEAITLEYKSFDVDYFKQEVIQELAKVQQELQNQFQCVTTDIFNEMKQPPSDILFESVIGCCALCPSCGEICDYTDHGTEIKHTADQHRSKLCILKFAVSDYWFISCNRSVMSCLYWKWFIGHFNESSKLPYRYREHDYPAHWKELEWRFVKQELEKNCI